MVKNVKVDPFADSVFGSLSKSIIGKKIPSEKQTQRVIDEIEDEVKIPKVSLFKNPKTVTKQAKNKRPPTKPVRVSNKSAMQKEMDEMRRLLKEAQKDAAEAKAKLREIEKKAKPVVAKPSVTNTVKTIKEKINEKIKPKSKSKPKLVKTTKNFFNIASSTKIDFPRVERLTNYDKFEREYYDTVGKNRVKQVRYETALSLAFSKTVLNSIIKTLNNSLEKNGPITVKFVMTTQSLGVREKPTHKKMFLRPTEFEREDMVNKQTIRNRLMQDDDIDDVTRYIYLHTKKSRRLTSKINTPSVVREALNELTEKAEIADRQGSGRILFIDSIKVKSFKFDPKKGGTYCELPQKIKNTQACINPQNGKDNQCMKWAILAGLFPKTKNANRISQYSKEEHLVNFTDIDFPVSSDQFDQIEQQNDFSFHVFECDNDGNLIHPYLYVSQCVDKKKKHVNLLLYNGHFCLIKKLDTFLKSASNEEHYNYNCSKCLACFANKPSFDKHVKTDCGSISDIQMPTKSLIPGIKARRLMPSLIRVYAQFDRTFVNDIQVVKGYTVRIVYDSIYDFSQWFKKTLFSYNGDNVFVEFAKTMDSIKKSIYTFTDYFKLSPFKISLTKKERDDVTNGLYKTCHICNKAFTKDQIRVEDHDHFKNGHNFRGLACQGCNLHYKAVYGGNIDVPVFVNGWSSVSSDIILALHSDKGRQEIIGKSINEVIAFRDSNIIFKNFSNFFSTDINESYESLPESSRKFSDMKFVDVFEHTRKLNIDLFKLDISHYFSLYSYAYDAAINNKDCDIHLPLDNEIMYYFKNNIIGGICTTGGLKRCATANNKYLKSFDPSVESKFIMPFDINASYVATMMNFKFPVSDYEKINESEFKNFTNDFILSLPPNGDYCYSFDIEAEYPKHLHDLHADFPIMPRRRNIHFDEMSEFNRDNIENFGTNTQLCVTLEKFEGAVDFRLLQFWIKRGITEFKIRRIFKSKQEFVFKTFMKTNYDRRLTAKREKNTALNETIKLTTNSVFGYTCKKEFEKKQFMIWSKPSKELERHLSNSCGIDPDITPDEKHLVTCKQSTKAKSVITSPYQIGFTILQLSKLALYEFFYAMKDFYGDNIHLLYTDTDSLYVEIKTDDVFEDFQNQTLASFVSQDEAGKFKIDVSDDSIITEFVAISAKMYSYSTDTKEVCKMAGVGKKFVPGIQSYRDCVDGKDSKPINVKIQVKESSKKGEMIKDIVKNVDREYDMFNASNIKVYQLSNNESLPYGHYKIASI